MHLELPSDVVEPLGHAEDGRDADAAGEQKRSLGGVRERKVILGSLISRTSPSWTLSCIAFEPPRELGTRSTPMR
jgi:hypothetical protein